jgi:hypothetical protein
MVSSRAKRFPKTLFALSRCRITRARDFGDLLSCSPVHAGVQDGVDYSGSASREKRQKSLPVADKSYI